VRGRRGHPAPRRTGGHPPVGEGWPASSGEPQTEAQDRTVPQACSGGCHVIQRERPQPFPGMSSPTPAAPGAGEGHSLPAQPSSAVRRDARAGEGGRHSGASAPMAGGAGLGSGGRGSPDGYPGHPGTWGTGPLAVCPGQNARGAGSRAQTARDPAPLRYVGVRLTDPAPVDGPPSSAHDEQNYGRRTIGPALRAGRAFAHPQKTSLRLRRQFHIQLPYQHPSRVGAGPVRMLTAANVAASATGTTPQPCHPTPPAWQAPTRVMPADQLRVLRGRFTPVARLGLIRQASAQPAARREAPLQALIPHCRPATTRACGMLEGATF
jgi:hypothetical protein